MCQCTSEEEFATRAELRSPDPACNPCTCVRRDACIRVRGRREELCVSRPSRGERLSDDEDPRASHGIESLPTDLGGAIKETENSRGIRYTLRDHVFDNFIALKKQEWDDYQLQVTQYEPDK
ncbi:MAG: hypothetical protein ACXV47_00860 [Halobacteriota archaeon]